MAQTTIKRWKLATVGVISSAVVYSGFVYELAHSAAAQNQQLSKYNQVLNERKALSTEIVQKQAIVQQLETSLNRV